MNMFVSNKSLRQFYTIRPGSVAVLVSSDMKLVSWSDMALLFCGVA